MPPGRGRGSLFHFMGLPSSPVIAVPVLQKRYHEIQWKFHPDQQQQQVQQQKAALSSSPGTLTRDALDESVYANIAYETLRDPFQRCKYLVKLILTEHRVQRSLTLCEAEQVHLDDNDEFLLKGTKDKKFGGTEEPHPGDDSAGLLLARYDPPASFLMEMMELNESVSDADPTEPAGVKQLEELLQDIKTRDAKFFADAVAAWEAQDLLKLKHTVLEWTYIANLKKQVINKLP
jgi:hypothetical protein